MDPHSDRRVDVAGPSTTGELRELGTGMTLGRYTLVRRIAAGGMAEVYAARSHGISGFEKKVAIKKILPQFSLNRRFVDMLVDEAKITVSLTHPNIAQIYELGLEGDTYYIVMEYVDGRPLNRLMQKLDVEGGQTVPVEHAAHIIAEVAKGLHHAHNQKDARGRPLAIVHRDVSPQNVLIAYTGDVKLIDFGIARAAGRAAQTSVGVIKGKLRYLAPEIAMGEEPDYRADVFCCGIVLFEMLTGEAMFAPRTDLEAIEMATAARVRSPCTANPNVPPDLEDIVMKALRRDRNERYQSAKELYTALRLFLNHHHPAYVGSELGDLMRAKFTSEIAEDRRLDDRAEQIMERAHSADVDPTEGVPEGELAGLIESVETTRPGKYRQIVTRAGIPLNQAGGGDGSQDDLQAEGDATEAHDQGEGDDPAFEPTMRAMNPLLPRDQDTRDVAPTVAAPPPTRPEIEPAIDPHDDSADELTASGEALVPDPAAAPVVVVTPTQRGQWTTLIFALAAALVISGGVWLGFAVVPAEPPPAKAAVVEPSPPAPPAPAPEPSTQLAVTPTVAAPSGTIILIDAEGEITSSDGRVEGTTITGVPLGKKIEIKVDRRRGTPWSTEVSLTSAEPVEIEVPKPARKQGTLWVNSFPYADVYVNGRSRGETPLELKLDADTYTILLKRPDGKIQKKRVTVKAGTKSSIRVKWPN